MGGGTAADASGAAAAAAAMGGDGAAPGGAQWGGGAAGRPRRALLQAQGCRGVRVCGRGAAELRRHKTRLDPQDPRPPALPPSPGAAVRPAWPAALPCSLLRLTAQLPLRRRRRRLGGAALPARLWQHAQLRGGARRAAGQGEQPQGLPLRPLRRAGARLQPALFSCHPSCSRALRCGCPPSGAPRGCSLRHLWVDDASLFGGMGVCRVWGTPPAMRAGGLECLSNVGAASLALPLEFLSAPL